MKALLSDFDFDLPEERIALHPVAPRDRARLLYVSGQGDLAHHHVYDLPGLLRPGDVLVVNDSKVIPARLYGKRDAAQVEFLLHRRLKDEGWEAFARPAKRLRVKDEVVFAEGFSAQVTAIKEDGLVDLSFNQIGESFRALLQRHGQVPLPPYIRRAANEADRDTYQTIYAWAEGSVAAPTAGLHFTPELVEKLKAKGVALVKLTLHVGGGTFLPVRSENLDAHVMHAEVGELSEEAAAQINAARARGGRVVAVGTTSCRLLESAADENGRVNPWRGETRLFIRPGYGFKAVDALLTNFHLPRSTLFMLACAFAGMIRLKAAYAEALFQNYRFYSYGDACFLERNA